MTTMQEPSTNALVVSIPSKRLNELLVQSSTAESIGWLIIQDASEFPELQWLYGLINRNRFIAGGAFRDIFTGQKMKIRDIDMWHRSKCDWETSINQLEKNKDFEAAYITVNGVGFLHTPTSMTVECINHNFGNPDAILNTFDFNIAKFALYMDEYDHMKVTYHARYFPELLARSLDLDENYIVKSADSFFNRLVKYMSYGYVPTYTVKARLFDAIRRTDKDVPLTDPCVAFYSH